MKTKLIVAVLLVSGLVACNSSSTNEKSQETVAASIPKDELEGLIEVNNEALTNSTNPDSLRFICQAQVDLCKQFVSLYGKDPKSPVFLSYQAKAHRANNQFTEAVAVYNTIEQRYTDYAGMPEVMFVKGFVLDEDLNDKDAAKIAYNNLITKFPNHPFSKDAQALLTQLHMSDEELIQSFEAKNKK